MTVKDLAVFLDRHWYTRWFFVYPYVWLSCRCARHRLQRSFIFLCAFVGVAGAAVVLENWLAAALSLLLVLTEFRDGMRAAADQQTERELRSTMDNITKLFTESSLDPQYPSRQQPKAN
jgi:hypothetical protein